MTGQAERAGRELAAAARFLTRIPLPASSATPSFGAAAFPIVGLLLGAGALAVDLVLALARSPRSATSASWPSGPSRPARSIRTDSPIPWMPLPGSITTTVSAS